MAALKPPTLGYLIALKQEMRSAFAEDDTTLTRYRQVRTQSRPVTIPDEAKLTDYEHRDSTVGDEMLRVVAALSLNPPTCQVTPARENDTQQQNATLREHWTEAVLMEAGKREDGAHTYRDVVDAACEGGAWCKLLFTKDTWAVRNGLRLKDYADDRAFGNAVEDAKKAAGVPFVWQAVDTLTVYPQWNAGKLASILEVTRRPLYQTLRQYRLTLADNGRIVPDEVGEALDALPTTLQNQAHACTFLEYWDDTWVVYAIEGYGPADSTDTSSDSTRGTLITAFKHGYGRVPYFFAPGFTLNWQRGRKLALGLSSTKLADVEYLSYLTTLHAQTVVRDAVPPMFRALPEGAIPTDGDDGEERAPTTWQIREIINGQPGEQLTPIQFPPVGPQLLEQIKLTQERIEAKSTPRVNANIGSGLEGAGFAINQVLAEARTNQDPIAKNIEAMLVELTRFLWHLVRTKVKETVWVYGGGQKSGGWLGAGPDDLTDTVKVEWQLDPERPTAKLIERRYNVEGLQAGLASLDMVIEAEGNNPDEVRQGRALDAIRATPWYQQKLQQYVAQIAGRGDLVQQAQQAEQMAQMLGQKLQAMQMGGGVQPAMGSGAVPDMANLAQAPGGGGLQQPVPLQSLGATQPPVTQQPGALGG